MVIAEDLQSWRTQRTSKSSHTIQWPEEINSNSSSFPTPPLLLGQSLEPNLILPGGQTVKFRAAKVTLKKKMHEFTNISLNCGECFLSLSWSVNISGIARYYVRLWRNNGPCLLGTYSLVGERERDIK